MFYRDRLNDDYEIHQRDYSYLKDELDVLVADAKVKRQSWHKSLMARLGDGLISVGNSMKEHTDEVQASTLASLTRYGNETISE